MKDDMIAEYAPALADLLPLARKAYGSRNTKSPQHDASREYTRLLVEFYAKGGSLLQLAAKLGVTYAGLRRRVLTDQIPAAEKNKRSKAEQPEIDAAVARIRVAKHKGKKNYHEQIIHEYEVNGVSLQKIAKGLGLSSANPLYYAVSRMRVQSLGA
jgi:lambda repressor-like predicted transcriptional regulator